MVIENGFSKVPTNSFGLVESCGASRPENRFEQVEDRIYSSIEVSTKTKRAATRHEDPDVKMLLSSFD